jgi:hypothetical protein
MNTKIFTGFSLYSQFPEKHSAPRPYPGIRIHRRYHRPVAYPQTKLSAKMETTVYLRPLYALPGELIQHCRLWNEHTMTITDDIASPGSNETTNAGVAQGLVFCKDFGF